MQRRGTPLTVACTLRCLDWLANWKRLPNLSRKGNIYVAYKLEKIPKSERALIMECLTSNDLDTLIIFVTIFACFAGIFIGKIIEAKEKHWK